MDDLEIVDLECDPPDVTLSSVSPATGEFNGGNIVTLTGTGFQQGVTTVQFGTLAANAINVIDSTTLQVRVPRVTGAASGKVRRADMRVDVTVQNPGSATLPSAYTYTLTQ